MHGSGDAAQAFGDPRGVLTPGRVVVGKDDDESNTERLAELFAPLAGAAGVAGGHASEPPEHVQVLLALWLIKRGEAGAGLPILRAALDDLRGSRFAPRYTFALGEAAEATGRSGDVAAGLGPIEEALTRSERNEERWCVAELLRIKGDLVLLGNESGAEQAAETCFRRSLDWARRRGALSWELRTAMSLPRVWRDGGVPTRHTTSWLRSTADSPRGSRPLTSPRPDVCWTSSRRRVGDERGAGRAAAAAGNIDGKSKALAEIVARNHPKGLSAEGEIGGMEDEANQKAYSTHTYGAYFAQVGVDADTGEIRLRRMLGVFALGRILNRKTARSQLIGGMIWGVSYALLEEAVVDTRSGAFVNRDLAGYLVPVHVDVPEIDAVLLDGFDDKVNILGAKGAGELGVCASGAAVANAVFNATGARVRDFPITLDKVLPGLSLPHHADVTGNSGDVLESV